MAGWDVWVGMPVLWEFVTTGCMPILFHEVVIFLRKLLYNHLSRLCLAESALSLVEVTLFKTGVKHPKRHRPLITIIIIIIKIGVVLCA